MTGQTKPIVCGRAEMEVSILGSFYLGLRRAMGYVQLSMKVRRLC